MTPYTVCASGAAYTTIQSAIDAAVAPAFVLVCPGTYTEAITLRAGVNVVAQIPGPESPTFLAGSVTMNLTAGGTVAWDGVQINATGVGIHFTGSAAQTLLLSRATVSSATDHAVLMDNTAATYRSPAASSMQATDSSMNTGAAAASSVQVDAGNFRADNSQIRNQGPSGVNGAAVNATGSANVAINSTSVSGQVSMANSSTLQANTVTIESGSNAAIHLDNASSPTPAVVTNAVITTSASPAISGSAGSQLSHSNVAYMPAASGGGGRGIEDTLTQEVTPTNVEAIYDNVSSQMTAETVQGAIDELAARNAGAASQVGFFDSDTDVRGDANLTWDNTNKRLGVGTISPAQKIELGAGSVAVDRRPASQVSIPSQFIGVTNTTGAFDGIQGAVEFETDSTGSQQLHFWTHEYGLGYGRRMTIAKDGDVGIGTTTPLDQLHVYEAGAAGPWRGRAVFSGQTASVVVGELNGKATIGGHNPALTVWADLVIQPDGIGNVGIGTGAPAHRLDVSGTAQVTGFKMPTGAGAGKVLTSDAGGNGTWQTTAARACPSGFSTCGGELCVKQGSTPMNFWDANYSCTDQGAHLCDWGEWCAMEHLSCNGSLGWVNDAVGGASLASSFGTCGNAAFPVVTTLPLSFYCCWKR